MNIKILRQQVGYFEYGGRGAKEAPSIEWSSLIFSVIYKGKTYYSYTPAQRFKSDNVAIQASPGPTHYNELIPKGVSLVGHIHLHWFDSHWGDERASNIGFSKGWQAHTDHTQMAKHHDLYFYVLGSSGILWGRYAMNHPPPDPRYPNHNPLKGTKYQILIDAYSGNPIFYPGDEKNKIPKYQMPKGTRSTGPVSF